MPFDLNPIVREETTKERVYKEIKQAILCGKISGSEFFTELQLADSLNTSRTPVREAMNDLLKEGLLVSVARKGFRVKQVTGIELEQIFLLRSTIESSIIRKITPTITEEEIELLEDICLQQEEAMQRMDNEHFIQLDQKFHIVFQRAAKYELIEQFLLNLHDLSKLTGLKALEKKNRMQEVLNEHRKIIQCLKDRNADEAAQVLEDHLRSTRDSISVMFD